MLFMFGVKIYIYWLDNIVIETKHMFSAVKTMYNIY